MQKVIGLTGYKGSGKDEVADALVRRGGWIKVGMSDPLNEYLQIINPYVGIGRRYNDLIESVGFIDAKKYPEVRRLLQVFGTEIVRERIDSYYWADLMYGTVIDALQEGKNVVVTGLRYQNEFDTVKALTGYTSNRISQIIRVTRPEYGQRGDTHSSEGIIETVNVDLEIVNDGSLQDLYDKVAKL